MERGSWTQLAISDHTCFCLLVSQAHTPTPAFLAGGWGCENPRGALGCANLHGFMCVTVALRLLQENPTQDSCQIRGDA